MTKVDDITFNDVEARLMKEPLLHSLAIEFAVRLGAGSPDSGSLFAIQHPELNASLIRACAHQPVKCIDFANEMTLAQSANAGLQDITPIFDF